MLASCVILTSVLRCTIHCISLWGLCVCDAWRMDAVEWQQRQPGSDRRAGACVCAKAI